MNNISKRNVSLNINLKTQCKKRYIFLLFFFIQGVIRKIKRWLLKYFNTQFNGKILKMNNIWNIYKNLFIFSNKYFKIHTRKALKTSRSQSTQTSWFQTSECPSFWFAKHWVKWAFLLERNEIFCSRRVCIILYKI